MTDFLLFLMVGFLAQAVDGALGMAYGVISSTVLIASGVTPAHASAAVHAAEVFTTGAAGWSHHHHRNIDWGLFWRLAPFGIVGGCLGAYVLTALDASLMRPIVTFYLALVGVWLLVRSFRKMPSRPVSAIMTAPLGAIGGFLDAAGGGGWGPIVTTGLLGAGGAPRLVIGTVNAAEFVITLSVSATFLAALVTGHRQEGGGLAAMGPSLAGLICGGLLAAPLAGFLVRRVSETLLLRAVGTLILLIAGTQTWRYLA